MKQANPRTLRQMVRAIIVNAHAYTDDRIGYHAFNTEAIRLWDLASSLGLSDAAAQILGRRTGPTTGGR